ncbi:MAG: hypothetical protein CM1200mP15_07580 [Dehalococcoidia bacterium]|nr:MAG: hypothetical protein CM1200mP15_07580 [Dehalococcoidia bacterium]
MWQRRKTKDQPLLESHPRYSATRSFNRSIARGCSRSLPKRCYRDSGSHPRPPIPDELLNYCSVITPNETDAEALIGFPVTNRETLKKLHTPAWKREISNAIIKLGEHGHFMRIPGIWLHPPFRFKAVDSVGAGDAFNGALAVLYRRIIP